MIRRCCLLLVLLVAGGCAPEGPPIMTAQLPIKGDPRYPPFYGTQTLGAPAYHRRIRATWRHRHHHRMRAYGAVPAQTAGG